MPSSSIAGLCDALVAAFEAKGVHVSDNLQPGLSAAQIKRLTKSLGFSLPDDLLQLYRWRNGHIDEEDPSEHVITFRDNAFISLERALEEREGMLKFYGTPEATLERTRVEIASCLPIARFMGAWTAVCCGEHLYETSRSTYPVISVYQGYDYYFDSVASMLTTCGAWVSAPEWRQGHGLPEAVEQAVWRAHNPGHPRYGA